MLEIMKEWDEKCDFIYLYANNTVLDFYPKFGFSSVKEYEYFKQVKTNTSKASFEKLNMDVQSNRDMLYDHAKNSNVFGNFSMHENADLVMFYCISFLKDNVYYDQSSDTIVIVSFNENQLHIWDIFSKIDHDLDDIINSLITSRISEIILGFSPKNCESYFARDISGKDTLFIQKEKSKLFDDNKLMFPLLSHA